VTPKDVLDLRETAKYLGIDESSLRALATERRIPCMQQDGGFVFSKKSIDKWRSQNTLRA
jgi:hypothetical protein